MKFKFPALLIILGILTISSCDKLQQKDRIKEGYIEYTIEYLNDTLDSFMIGLLPKKMIIKFKDNNTLNKIEGFSGIVSFTHIQNYKEKKNTTLVKVLNKKYRYEEKMNESSLFFEELPGMKIKLQDEVKDICGFKAHKAKIILPDSRIEPFYIYYTNDISINNVNSQTPFKSIDGVLLEFQVKFYDLDMKLTATKVQEAEISSEHFKVPDGYQKINRKTMVEIIELLKQ
ncbi:MAG: hypothetical protein V2I54_09840 [Bacteroidales bacterium]|jgi:GLPGLI family protein|nr:hypothetical protein [Bacteroidales bacterium]